MECNIQNEIKGIAFDLDGVALKGSFNHFINELYTSDSFKKNNRDKSDFRYITKKDNYLKDTGIIAITNLFRKIHPNLTLDEIEEIVMLYTSEWKLHEDMFEKILKPLCKKDIVLAAASNLDKMNLAVYRAKEYLNWMDFGVFSCEIGLAKPDISFFIKIYQEFSLRHSISKENILFIDDNIDNVNSANKLGINTICFDNRKESVDVLVNKLKEINVL